MYVNDNLSKYQHLGIRSFFYRDRTRVGTVTFIFSFYLVDDSSCYKDSIMGKLEKYQYLFSSDLFIHLQDPNSIICGCTPFRIPACKNCVKIVNVNLLLICWIFQLAIFENL